MIKLQNSSLKLQSRFSPIFFQFSETTEEGIGSREVRVQYFSRSDLRNWTEEEPPWPSKTAANENPSSPSVRTTTSSSISSRRPWRLVYPHRTPVVREDGASIAMAEQQHRPLSLATETVGLGLDLTMESWLGPDKTNRCSGWLSNAMDWVRRLKQRRRRRSIRGWWER